MKAIILAAGLGTRLRPITNEVPKCMVPVNGIRIIDKQIDNLLSNGVDEIYVVDGYKAEVLAEHLKANFPQVHIVSNPRYAETNNMYSLYLTSKYVKGEEFLLMNADVYYDSNIIAGMLQGENLSKIACDRSQYLEESMKITLDGEKINHISKKISEVDHYAVSIDVYRISAEDSKVLFNEVEDTIEGRKDENSWTEVALDNIFPKTSFKPYVIEGRWFEIDNHDDLHKAEEIFKGDKLCKN
jgi:choline kinase